jgi:hypothetical protein
MDSSVMGALPRMLYADPLNGVTGVECREER